MNITGAQQLSKTELLTINGGKLNCFDSQGQCTEISCRCAQFACRPLCDDL